jgi:two-component system chemotaxis response regulator CheB
LPGHDIIVVGASAGGVNALKRLVGELPADLPATLFVVLHVSPEPHSQLAEILEAAGPLPASAAIDGTRFRRGHIYVAPADRHLLIEDDGRLRVIRGPKENLHRPAVDPLFRSAAWACGPRVVGVVLSGTLDDGAAGLWAIKSCGGVTIVQDPEEAEFDGMPTAALLSLQVDHCVPLAGIPPLLERLARRPVTGRSRKRPRTIKAENDFMKKHATIESMTELGKPSGFTCPSCRGALWELQNGGILRYRCHTGHAFSVDSLLNGQSEAVEEALYSALRALEERASIVRKMIERYGERFPRLVDDYRRRSRELEQQADLLRGFLVGGFRAKPATN